jgi:hypothetical protein
MLYPISQPFGRFLVEGACEIALSRLRNQRVGVMKTPFRGTNDKQPPCSGDTPLEAVRQYLQAMPQLSDLLLEFLGEIMEAERIDYNKMDEMREAYKRAQAEAVEATKTRAVPYYVVTFPQAMYKCDTCQEEVRGGYYEISNPLTATRGMFRVRLMHEFLVHGNSIYSEPIVNMSETQLGIDTHQLDAKKLLKILKGLPVPEAVILELQAALESVAKVPS